MDHNLDEVEMAKNQMRNIVIPLGDKLDHSQGLCLGPFQTPQKCQIPKFNRSLGTNNPNPKTNSNPFLEF